MKGRQRVRAGLTLLELIVAIVLLGTIAATATLAMRPGTPPLRTEREAAQDSLRALRLRAIEERRPLSTEVVVDSTVYRLTAWPSGAVTGAGIVGADRLSGALDP